MTQAFYLVAGLGKTGQSIAGYLQRRNIPFVVFDTRKQIDGLAEFNRQFPGVDVFTGELPATVYDQLTGIIASPGLSFDEPVLQEAFKRKIPVFGDIECLAREVKVPVVAITGTNGKSTVTTLVGEMAQVAGITVAVAGNIGAPVLDLLDDGIDYKLWVLELSSFQLDLTRSLKPIAATILNISPDHLDRHHSIENYIAAKQAIYHQASYCLFNRDDEATRPGTNHAPDAHLVSYGLNKPAQQQWGLVESAGSIWLAKGEQPLLKVDELGIKGKHNWQNALAAAALAEAAGIDQKAILSVLRSFGGLDHRCQWVRTLDQVDWINDSKGTNIGATISAILGLGGAMQGKIVLIAGGLGKGADFNELRPAVSDFVRSMVLIGADADKIDQAVGDLVPVLRADSLEMAVKQARTEAQSGDIVLLSPACASLDMFRDFNHRGDVFADLVRKL